MNRYLFIPLIMLSLCLSTGCGKADEGKVVKQKVKTPEQKKKDQALLNALDRKEGRSSQGPVPKRER